MRKINYRITVNITQKTMKLGFRAKMPDEMQGKRIRVQAAALRLVKRSGKRGFYIAQPSGQPLLDQDQVSERGLYHRQGG